MFLVSEDNSIHYLKLYGAKHGDTPNIDRIAAEGLTFDNAFSNAPVCSVARSTLATGILAPRLGTQYHRKSALARLPEGVKPWSATLRDNGYFCTNLRKTDYNFDYPAKELWDPTPKKGNPWSGRKDSNTPFFHMQSFAQSHESSLHFKASLMETEKTTTDPKAVELFPYHPDTPTFRYTHARYHDRQTVIDGLIGQIVANLEKDGLLEDTFIFIFGDHGGVLPRSKGYAYESGLHVPLVVRIPANFKHLANHKPGTRTGGFVSFIDFGPTLLNLAGIKVPNAMDGRPFLGSDICPDELAKRDMTFGYADRFDEKYDLVRTIRKGRYKYNRNYEGFYPDGLQNNYRYRMLAFSEWRNLDKEGRKLDKIQQQFFRPRPPEQLFDIINDPHEVHNIATNPEHRDTLLTLRTLMTNKIKEINDLSFYPESYMVRHALSDGIGYGNEHSDEIANLVDIADLQLGDFSTTKPKLLEHLASQNSNVCYWALKCCTSFGLPDKEIKSAARKLLEDKNNMVRTKAAEFLGSIGEVGIMETLYEVVSETKSPQEQLLSLNTMAYLRDYKGYKVDPARLPKRGMGESVRRLEYFQANSSN
jgi:arylsulfatase A-like enzyme